MGAKQTKTETVVCPECGGATTVQGHRYTEPLKVCPTCKGEGTVEQPVESADAA